eukprot:scaffold257374_cov43-Tisochrysis_lutea.AAC.3
MRPCVRDERGGSRRAGPTLALLYAFMHSVLALPCPGHLQFHVLPWPAVQPPTSCRSLSTVLAIAVDVC